MGGEFSYGWPSVFRSVFLWYHNTMSVQHPDNHRQNPFPIYFKISFKNTYLFLKSNTKSSFQLSFQFHIGLSSFFLFSRSYRLLFQLPFRSGLIMLQNLFLASPIYSKSYIRGSYVFYLALFILFYSPDLLHVAAFSSFFKAERSG